MNYILASASPQRKELLTQAGFTFESIPSTAQEEITKTSPHHIVMELAFQKALNVFELVHPDDTIVIGADTIVVYNDDILLKPCSKEEAFDMLSLLSGRTHQVYTGVSLITKHLGKQHTSTFYDKTDVTFYPISRMDLQAYVDSNDPMDKAGSYGIQGSFAIHVKSICGDYNNVVGLPLSKLYQKLTDFLSSLSISASVI